MRNNWTKKQKKRFAKIGAAIALVILMVAAVAVPIPSYYVESPGSTIDLKTVIKVNDKEDKEKGSFSLTSVFVGPATIFRLLKAELSDFEEVVTKKDLMGDSNSDEYDQLQMYYMKASKNTAIAQAFELADVDYSMDYKGLYVMTIQNNSNFKDDLSLGDTIIEVDGKNFDNNEGFMNYIKSKKVGDEVTITFLHDGKEKTSTQKLVKLKGEDKAGIGISLVDDSEIVSDTEVDIATGSIGGPSAGMMFTLQIYDQLTKGNLRKGKEIAGTGTISSDGTVGRIGGIDKKVASASKSGADVFFAPDDEITKEEKKASPGIKSNYKEALEAAEKLDTDMKVVPVKTVQDAIDYLNDMK